jgi:hypothetical protein
VNLPRLGLIGWGFGGGGIGGFGAVRRPLRKQFVPDVPGQPCDFAIGSLHHNQLFCFSITGRVGNRLSNIEIKSEDRNPKSELEGILTTDGHGSEREGRNPTNRNPKIGLLGWLLHHYSLWLAPVRGVWGWYPQSRNAASILARFLG